MTTSLGKDTSSAKTSRYEVSFYLFHLLAVICLLFDLFFSFGRMTVCITGNHGLWVCKKRLRGSNRKFSAMRTFLESVRHLR